MPDGELLAASDVALLRVVGAQLAAVPERTNRLSGQVGEDIARLTDAADAGPGELRAVLLRFPRDDAITHLEFAPLGAEDRSARLAAHEVLVRLKAAWRTSRDTVWEWEPPREEAYDEGA